LALFLRFFFFLSSSFFFLGFNFFSSLFKIGCVIATFWSIFHDEVTLFIKRCDLFFISNLIFFMHLFIFYLIFRCQSIPDFTTFFHCFGMGAFILFFDLVYIFSCKKQICWQWFFRYNTILSILFFGINIQICWLLAICSHKKSLFSEFFHLLLISLLVYFAFISVRLFLLFC